MPQTYQQIKLINVITLGYWPTMVAIRQLLSNCKPGSVIKILDVGCGDGDTLRHLAKYGRRKGYNLELTGIDLNLEAITAAIELTPPLMVNYIHGDVFLQMNTKTYDVIINSLTMHHLTNKQILTLIKWMTANAKIGWSISDLHRHAIAYNFIKYFTKIFNFNFIVCHDAPLSVAKGFTRRDWIELLTEGNLDPYSFKISWYPNFRYGIVYEQSL